MKTKIILAAITMAGAMPLKKLQAQELDGRTVAVLGIDTKGVTYDPVSMGGIVRLELEKAGRMTVMDKYEQEEIIGRSGLDVSSCFGKSCLLEAGKALGVEFMLTGSVERFGEKIVVSLRLISVKSGMAVRTDVREYANIQPEIQRMIRISLNNILGIENDRTTVEALTQYESAIPASQARLNLSGPRMGAAYITGYMGRRLQDPQSSGGFDGYPVLSQFGYQFETQYMTSGNFQALLEYVFVVSGLDQGIFIPSFTFMNGFRSNKKGWEVAFGPVVSLRRKARGFYTMEEGGSPAWHLVNEWSSLPESRDSSGMVQPNPYPVVEGLDRRGTPAFNTGWVWSVGKTFHSGHMNIPVNAYVAPNKAGWYVGLSLGFNMNNLGK